MDGRKVLLPSQEPNEKIYLTTRHHWLSFFPIFIISLVMAAVPIIFLALAKTNFPSVLIAAYRDYVIFGISAYLLFTCAFLMISWLDYYYDILIITNERLVHIEQHGLFNRHVSELNLMRVQNVSTRIRGILPTVFEYGLLIVETAARTGVNEAQEAHFSDFTIEHVPSPNKLASLIMRLHDQLVEHYEQEDGAACAEGEVRPHPANINATSAPSSAAPPSPIAKTSSSQSADEGQLNEGEMIDL